MSRLDSEVQAFVDQHPDGWSHMDWDAFLAGLSAKHVDVSDTDQIGARLEAERLRRVLLTSGVDGLGRRRVDAIVEKFGSVWNLRQADPEQVASIPTIPRRIAEETLSRIMR